MAKINFIAKKIDESLLRTLRILKSQQFEVLVWTSSSEKSKIPDEVKQVYFPFTNWSIREVSRFFLRFVASPGEIFQFHLSEEMRFSEQALIQAFQAIPQHSVIVTVKDKFQIPNNRQLRSLLQTCKFLTFESYPSLFQAHQLFPKRKNQKRVFIPPLLEPNHVVTEENTTLLTDFLQTCRQEKNPYFLIAPFAQDNALLQLLPEFFPTLFLRSDDSDLSEFEWKTVQQKIFERAKHPYYFLSEAAAGTQYGFSKLEPKPVFFMAGLQLSTSAQIHFMELALSHNLPLILDSQQSMNYSSIWKHGKNCWIVLEEKLDFDAGPVLQTLKKSLAFPDQIEKTESSSLDSYYNEISRLYSRSMT